MSEPEKGIPVSPIVRLAVICAGSPLAKLLHTDRKKIEIKFDKTESSGKL